MQALLGLILIAIFTISSGTVILIKVQVDTGTWYGLALLGSIAGCNWKVSVIRTQPELEATNGNFNWSKCEKFEFQFVQDEESIKQSRFIDMAKENYWIDAIRVKKIMEKIKNKTNQFTMQLQRPISLHDISSTQIFAGFKTSNKYILMMVIPIAEFENYKGQFETEITPIMELEDGQHYDKFLIKSMRIRPATGYKSAVHFVNAYYVVAKHDNLIQYANETEYIQTLTTSDCFIQFFSNNGFHYGLGKINYNISEKCGTLWLHEIWNPITSTYENANQSQFATLIQNANKSFKTTLRDDLVNKQPPPTQLLLREPPQAYSAQNLPFQLDRLTAQVFMDFNFGDKGEVECDLGGTVSRIPVFDNKMFKTITFIGVDVETFENFRKATKAANELSKNAAGKQMAFAAVMRLITPQTKASPFAYNGNEKISISDANRPYVSNQFRSNVIHQYSYCTVTG